MAGDSRTVKEQQTNDLEGWTMYVHGVAFTIEEMATGCIRWCDDDKVRTISMPTTRYWNGWKMHLVSFGHASQQLHTIEPLMDLEVIC